jgi:predicted site-specific integrase-resolvase
MQYVSRSKAAEHFGVSGQTIAKWAKSGKLEYFAQPSGQKRYAIRLQDDGQQAQKVCYCRVSSSGQKDDLKRQVDYMRAKYPGWIVVTDIGSGLNWKRKGLRAVLQRSLQGSISVIAVAHKDRLARFGFDIIEFMLAQKGVRIVCDSNDEHRSREEELVEDIISIITVFSSKVYGHRKYKRFDTGQTRPSVSNKRPRGGA